MQHCCRTFPRGTKQATRSVYPEANIPGFDFHFPVVSVVSTLHLSRAGQSWVTKTQRTPTRGRPRTPAQQSSGRARRARPAAPADGGVTVCSHVRPASGPARRCRAISESRRGPDGELLAGLDESRLARRLTRVQSPAQRVQSHVSAERRRAPIWSFA
jgi:hypothetical protein